jgi:hypothetical protein
MNIFNYNGNMSNPVSQKIIIQEQLFDDDETGIAHIYPAHNVVFVEADRGLLKKEVPIEDISQFVVNRNDIYNFFRQILSNITKLDVISSSGNSYDVVENNELDSTLSFADKIVLNAEFIYKDKHIYYESHKLDVPNSVPKTDLMTGFISSVR